MARSKVPHEETPSEKLRKRSQAENLIDYSFTMSLMARAKLQHLLSIHLKYKYAVEGREGGEGGGETCTQL